MRNWLGIALIVGFALLLAFGWNTSAAEKAEPKAKGGSPHYTVVATDGSHVIVTDNQKSKLYFYAIGPDEKIGDPLHLRGTLDLTQVGQPVLTPVTRKAKQ
jgi:hypothetical protein